MTLKNICKKICNENCLHSILINLACEFLIFLSLKPLLFFGTKIIYQSFPLIFFNLFSTITLSHFDHMFLPDTFRSHSTRGNVCPELPSGTLHKYISSWILVHTVNIVLLFPHPQDLRVCKRKITFYKSPF